MQLVGMMDGVNRYRFQKEPQLLVAWKAARHVVSGPQAEEEEAEEPGTPTAPTQPGSTGQPGEVRPAA